MELVVIRRHIKGSIMTSMVVGSILSAINQGNEIMVNGITLQILGVCLTNFLVPFCVSLYSRVSSEKEVNRINGQ